MSSSPSIRFPLVSIIDTVKITTDSVTIQDDKSFFLSKAGVDDLEPPTMKQLRAEEAARIAADADLARTKFTPVNVLLSSQVIPDESQPIPIPSSIINTYAVDGWYFKNGGPGTSTRKINWYFGAPTQDGVATYKSLSEISIPATFISKSSIPFFTIYTKPKASDNATDWYNARKTFVGNNNNALQGDSSRFLLRLCPNPNNSPKATFPNFTVLDLVVESFTSQGTIMEDDEILAMSIGTDSSAAAGHVQCIIHGLEILSSNGNISYSLSNTQVLHKFMLDKLDVCYSTFGQTRPSDGLVEST